MKFQFKDKESIIYDFLKFPKCLFHKEILSDFSISNNYSETIDEKYFELLKKISERLSHYSKEIEIFYVKRLFDFDFIDLFIKVYPILNYDSPKSYINSLQTLNISDIKNSIIYALLENERNKSSKDIKEEANMISSNNEKTVKFINELPIESNVKWNLFLIIQEPIKYLKKYIDLMFNILPIFEEVYKNYEQDVKNYGKYLVNYLNVNGASGIEEISNSLLNKTIFLDDINDIMVSAIFPYSISIIDYEEQNLIVWGIKIEDSIKKIKEQYNNKLNERIQIFKNLGDKTRYEVLKLISQGITSTKEIASLTGVSSATVSYHINALLTSKLIKIDNSNRKFSYVVDFELLENIINDLKNDLNFPK